MNHDEITVIMILSGWENGQDKIHKALSVLSDKNMDLELPSGRNKVSWIIGHLGAVNDSLFTILGVGEKLNENYYNYFRDGSVIMTPDISQIRHYWQETASQLNKKITALSADDWFEKHTLVSSEDFAKEPHRNKLNVLLSRTFHLHHHYGQLAPVLKSIEAKEKINQ